MSLLKKMLNRTTLKLVIGEFYYNKRANWWSAGAIILTALSCITLAHNGENMYVRDPYNFIWALIPAGSFRYRYYTENRAGIIFKLPASRNETATAFYTVQYIYSICTYLTLLGLTIGFAGYINMNYILNNCSLFLFALMADLSINIFLLMYIKETSKRDYNKLNAITLFAGLGFFFCLFQTVLFGDNNLIARFWAPIFTTQIIVLIYQQTMNYKYFKKMDYKDMPKSNDAGILMDSLNIGSFKIK